MATTLLKEEFRGAVFDSRLRWLNEPARWYIDASQNKLVIEPDAGTDFWQRTHYQLRADNGHFLFLETAGAFSLETEVDFFFQHQYDQAGLMVRVSPGCWIKTSIEYEPHEENWLGAVVTDNGFSDWSTQKLSNEIESLQFKITRKRSDYLIEYRDSRSKNWVQLRLAHLQDTEKIQCGLYACSPKDGGFVAKFRNLVIKFQS